VVDIAKANEEHPAEITEINKDVYDKIAYRGSTEGILAVFRSLEHTLENLIITKSKPLILVAEAPEKPGNIGAILRTADAAAIDNFLSWVSG